jgi:hypothetical protein
MAFQILAAMAAVVVVGGPGYAEAEKRALAYDSNSIGTAYDIQMMYPVISQADVLKACANILRVKLTKETPRFRIVVSFKDSAYDTVFLNTETKLSRCVADHFAHLPLPKAPIPDYAERMTFVFEDTGK